MIQYKEFEFKNENGDTFEIRVTLTDKFDWAISNVGVKKKGKRSFAYIMGNIRDVYSYRRLSVEDRKKYELKVFVETAGIDLLNKAIRMAWESIRPKEISEEDYSL